MVEKVKYPNINAKLKGMYAKTLSKEDFEDLLKQNSIKDAIILLKEKLEPLEDLSVDATRIELESKLDSLIINDINKIYKHLDKRTKEVFDSYFLKYKLKILKIMWKDLVIGKQKEDVEIIIEWVSFFKDLKGIENVQNVDEFLNKISNRKIKKIFQDSQSLFDLEGLLSKYYFENLYFAVREKSDKLKSLVSAQIDVINIESIYRCKKYYGFYKMDYFINYGKLLKKEKVPDIEKVQDIQEVKEILKNEKHKEIVEASTNGNFKKILYKDCKKYFRQNLFDMSSLISYFYIREIEQSNIITIIEGIRYRLSKDEIKNNVVL